VSLAAARVAHHAGSASVPRPALAARSPAPDGGDTEEPDDDDAADDGGDEE
jgi:hypothetical protein